MVEVEVMEGNERGVGRDLRLSYLLRALPVLRLTRMLYTKEGDYTIVHIHMPAHSLSHTYTLSLVKNAYIRLSLSLSLSLHPLIQRRKWWYSIQSTFFPPPGQ